MAAREEAGANGDPTAASLVREYYTQIDQFEDKLRRLLTAKYAEMLCHTPEYDAVGRLMQLVRLSKDTVDREFPQEMEQDRRQQQQQQQ